MLGTVLSDLHVLYPVIACTSTVQWKYNMSYVGIFKFSTSHIKKIKGESSNCLIM